KKTGKVEESCDLFCSQECYPRHQDNTKFPAGYYLSPPYCSPPASPAASPPQVSARLENRELWKKFDTVGTEMILTKNGRRMFPEFSVSLSGLDPHSLYSLCVQAVPDGENRYKWRDGAWSMSGRAEPGPPTRLYLHPESPAPGHRWMERPICFNKIRLTNNTLSQGGQLVLQSMHRYYLRLHIIPTSNNRARQPPASSISFPETSFIAVTSYQNPRLSLLKIEENPFAKGIKYFKSQQEHNTLRKRRSKPGADEDGSPEYKRHTEGAAEQTTLYSYSGAERQLDLDESTEEKSERLQVSEETTDEEKRDMRVEERDETRPPIPESPRGGDTRDIGCSAPQSGDVTHEEWTGSSQRMDSLVHWDPITRRAVWAPALSPLPVPTYPPACPVDHRFAAPSSPALAAYSSPVSNLPPVGPYLMGAWTSAPVRLSYPLPALHPPFMQQVCTTPWYLPPHATTRGL
ncbi:T-box transcription factor TBX6-like, partial [Engystomops pustulosus]|uniref:T-box transcription factor TBX6-like n=1 Tax=Engystomops pustulosus TaxID=76066 RepID=UPI003AFB4A62